MLHIEDALFKPLHRFRCFRVEDFPHGFLIENCLINVDVLENKTDTLLWGNQCFYVFD